MSAAQCEAWKQGCRAVFAGFVAASHAQELEATIDAFWDSEQKDIVLSSLQSLRTDIGEDPKRGLYNLLNSKDNKLTRLVRMETDDMEPWDAVAWELTRLGKKTFPKVVVAVQPRPIQRKGSWWDE